VYVIFYVSGDLKLYQYRRFENVAFSSWNPYMKFVFLFVFFVSHVILMGCNSYMREPGKFDARKTQHLQIACFGTFLRSR